MWAAVLIGISVNYFVIFENKVRIMDFLLLPANLKEKFAAKIISLGICYPIVTFVGATIAIFFGSKITGNPLSATEAIAAIFVFYPFQALLLWGSIHFKKNGLLKSVIVFAIIALFTGIIYIFTNAGLATVYPYYNAVYEYKKISDGYLPNLVKYYGIFSAVFATISLWTVSYFGLKEKEV
jgi:hypothetical protein